ncbi:hypothetical protein O6H91_Y471900 [Diphasiastrum complanatum]|nr:hypothetical protein O6H91_Y471900 [Diphasiastrum complanatum]
MEFLSRSWSISAIDVSKALAPHQANDTRNTSKSHGQCPEELRLETTPFTFASTMTSQMVMDRILTPTELSLFTPRRNSHSNGPLLCQYSGPLSASPPPSPRQADEFHTCRNMVIARAPIQGHSVRRWFRDLKEKKKEIARAHNAQVHAAISVAGVAAAIAAVAAATAASAIDDGGTKTSMAVASAASLVAAQCVEVAENMGADRDQVSSIVSSAVNVKTAGDIKTLTAAAATALRGAAILKARTLKETCNFATVAPIEKGGSHCTSFSGDLGSEDSEAEFYTQELLARGCEFLKRTKKGEVHWRLVFVYLDERGQVILKLQSRHIRGAFKKNKKSLVVDLYTDMPAWPGRNLLDNGGQRRYFGLKTTTGMAEFECKSEYEYKLWTHGISHLLTLSNSKQ